MFSMVNALNCLYCEIRNVFKTRFNLYIIHSYLFLCLSFSFFTILVKPQLSPHVLTLIYKIFNSVKKYNYFLIPHISTISPDTFIGIT